MATERIVPTSILAFALGLAACEQPAGSPDEAAHSPAAPASMIASQDGEPGLDGEFLALERQVSGFAGYYHDEAGNLVVQLIDPRQEPAARAALAAIARHRPARPGIAAGPAAIRVRQARFDIRALNGWHHALAAVLGIDGVTFLDTDERANRVAVGVASQAVAGRVRALAEHAGVPREALVVEVAASPLPVLTLSDYVRPVEGGLEIWGLLPYGGVNKCTLGFNVRYGSPSYIRSFLTASHCTAKPLASDATQFTQGNLPIGTELSDPGRFDQTRDTRCPATARCRYSDVALIAYNDTTPWALGYLAQTRWSMGPGYTDYTLEINPYYPQFQITSTYSAVVGAYVEKMGRTTGWTYGQVTRTCVDYPYSPVASTWLLCQDEVGGTAEGGDSGSPVFKSNSTYNTASVAGILWGSIKADSMNPRRFVYSPIEQIRRDLGIILP